MNNLTTQLEQANKNITNLTQEIQQKDKQIENLTQEMNNLTTQLEQANKKIENLTKQIEELTKPSKTTLTINPIKDAQYDDTIIITGELVDEDNRTVQGTINLNINGKNITVETDKTGKYQYEYTITKMTDLNITATYTGTEKFTPSNASTTVTVIKQDTNIIFDNIKEINSGDKVTITGQLIDGNEKGFYGTIKLLINNARATIKTYKEGYFTYTTTLSKVGTNNITASYIESAKYKAGNSTTTVTVTPLDTSIIFEELAPTKSGETVTITGKLVDEKGNPVVGTIKLLINNGRATVKTDKTGAFTYAYNATRACENTITANYLVNNNYEASETITTFTVVKA